MRVAVSDRHGERYVLGSPAHLARTGSQDAGKLTNEDAKPRGGRGPRYGRYYAAIDLELSRILCYTHPVQDAGFSHVAVKTASCKGSRACKERLAVLVIDDAKACS